MTYEEFKAEYEATLIKLMGYAPDTAGHNIFAGKLADLVDLNTDHADRYDEELG